jgi:DNA-binding response OmpR family regulator
MKTKILLAEDDPSLGKLLSEYLKVKGFDNDLADDGKRAFELFMKNSYDICVFDVMMPVKDGFTLAKEIRTLNTTIPIVFLTAKNLKDDTIQGFTVGADDYITKPFSMEELVLRLNAILRRTKPSETEQPQNEFTIGTIRFTYLDQNLEYADGRHQKLTSKEADLLRLLCLNMNNVLDRTYALQAIWNDDSYFNARSMDVYITKLRKYLKEDPSIEIINIHGKGFRLLIQNN